jgi:hypothetical protein
LRREAKTDQDRAGHRDWSAETRGAFEKRAEGKGDERQLQPPVARDPAGRLRQRCERAGRHGQAVEKNNIEHDPADGEKAHDRSQHRRPQRQPCRHREQQDGDQDRDDERNDCGNMGLNLTGRDQHEKRHHRQCSGERGKDGTIEWIVDLIPHERRSRPASPRHVSFSAKEPAAKRRTALELDEAYRPDAFARIPCTNFIFGLCDEPPDACYGQTPGRDNTALD